MLISIIMLVINYSVRPVGIQNIQNNSHLAIEADSKSTNLSTPVTFYTVGIPADSREAVTGFEWFINGTPLQSDAGPTATVLFQRAGIYQVYAEAVFYNGSSIMSNRVQMQVVPSGFWNGSDMAAVGGYYSGPLLIHAPSNYSAYVLWNGPGVYLPLGEYIVNFTMAISNTTGSSYPVISLEVQGSVNSTASVVFAKNIVRGDFPGPNKFTTFTMVFNQTFQRNIGFNFMGNSASTNLTIYLKSIIVNYLHYYTFVKEFLCPSFCKCQPS